MALNQTYELYDLLYDRFGGKKDIHKMSRVEIVYLKKLRMKRDDKSSRRVEDIKLRIVNDLNKNSFNKKYQIQSFWEYNIIREWCKKIDTKGYELLWHEDANVKRNQLYKIIEGNYYCCKDCDRPITFISRQVPVKYCYLFKANNLSHN
jgi:RNA polymerase-binding transcription factor DksA